VLALTTPAGCPMFRGFRNVGSLPGGGWPHLQRNGYRASGAPRLFTVTV
jgi:hypothetical protein